MNKQQQALKLALEALEESVDLVRNEYATDWRHGIPSRKAQLDGMNEKVEQHALAITTIREALTQPASDDKAGGEVVAVVDSGLSGGIGWTEAGRSLEDGQELFTRPQPQAAQPVERVAQKNDCCAPNHFCDGRMAHLPEWELCNKCGCGITAKDQS